jgi:hypothetical protein
MTNTEQTLTKLTLGDNLFFVNNFKTDFDPDFTDGLVAVNRP